MNKKGLIEKLEKEKVQFFTNQSLGRELIMALPDNVDCVAFVGNGNVYFLQDTNTLEEHLRQIDQFASLNPEIIRKGIYENKLCCSFSLSNGNRLNTYSYAIEELLEYYFEDNCKLKKVQSVELRLECTLSGKED